MAKEENFIDKFLDILCESDIFHKFFDDSIKNKTYYLSEKWQDGELVEKEEKKWEDGKLVESKGENRECENESKSCECNCNDECKCNKKETSLNEIAINNLTEKNKELEGKIEILYDEIEKLNAYIRNIENDRGIMKKNNETLTKENDALREKIELIKKCF